MQPRRLDLCSVLPRTYDDQICSVARTLEVVGDRWTLLVIRDAFLGLRRFEDFQKSLGVARNVLTERLNRLVDEGILRRRLYQERPERYEYRLTRKGVDLWPMMMTAMKWGDRYLYPEAHPRLVLHKGCGGEIDERLHCSRCGAELGPTDIYVEAGPAATAAA
jgi:DNA-binding HxlR family transcriptional regulator